MNHLDNKLIGMVACRNDSGNDIQFNSIFVDPEMRGLGYGSEAIQWLEKLKFDAGYVGSFSAELNIDHGRCIYFWMRLGYKPVIEKETVLMVRVL